MPFRILADECIQSKRLIAELRTADHDVLTASEAGVVAFSDSEVFQKAIAENRIVLTANCIDFVKIANLFKSNKTIFPGLFLLYKDGDENKDMSNAKIVRAMTNLEMTGTEIANNFHNLNNYNY